MGLSCRSTPPPETVDSAPHTEVTVAVPGPPIEPVDGPPEGQAIDNLITGVSGPTGAPIWAVFHTSLGDIPCRLKEDHAPQTVANFVGLATGNHPYTDPDTGRIAASPFFDDAPFHRLLPGLLIQGGDPTGRGDGGPGYSLALETETSLSHDQPGTLSAARDGDQSAGSQFLITERPMPELDGHHTIFGRCIAIDIIQRISHAPTTPMGRPAGSSPAIETVSIRRTHDF